jgi:murein DD-endopeptidase MepM/ murein hydrolase activator NlpD
MIQRQAACLAACAAAVLAGSVRASAADPTPCVGAGVLATLAPGSTVPTVIGPSVAAADRQSTTANSYLDPATQLTLDQVEVGAAGCTGGTTAPGGTSTRATVWRVLGNSVGANTLEVDLVPSVSGDGSGWRLRAHFDGLEVNAQPVTVAVGEAVAVGTWGVLRSQVSVDAGAGQELRWWRAALALQLTRAHGGYAAGTTFLIGWVSADRRPAPPPKPPVVAVKPKPRPTPKPPTTTTTTTTTAATTTTLAPPPKQSKPPKAKPKTKPKVKHVRRGYHPTHDPLRATPPLGLGTYDFPVTGTVAWGDTYGANRSDVPGGWHHGDDLFAKLGTPIVAVADGTVFAVGWNRVGGWRLWLRDRLGNAFYYAHFAGYTALAHDNNQVRRGQVLGFVGNTGDAHTTLPHLHFEVHPNGLLFLGYDGAVDPTTYLGHWRRVDHIKSPPPVALPSHAPAGQGALTDFRRLLALRPLAHGAASTPKLQSRPGNRLDAGATTARAAAVAGGSSSRAPVVAAVSLLLLAALSVGLTAWSGRAR